MAIASYSELVAAIADYLDDATLSAKIPTMIRLAEAEFNRTLNVMEQEARAYTTATGEYVTLPADAGTLRAVYLVSGGYIELEAMSLAELRRAHWDMTAGRPRNYAVADGQVILGPIPDGNYRLEMVYVQDIPALTAAAPTNWLLGKHPDLYLMGSLSQAEFFNWNDDRLPLLSARVQSIVEQIGKDGNSRRVGAAPIRMRTGVRW